ncbi:hypothetical protein SAMN05660860_01164 [Geoalkalibacter ferrihydriticus]|uniref:Uncharacterized protein n=2 Tax=Geoalkalibacter ferrihydriticus TaxID=392333 RepID=A0A0C2DW86_9BACT|nr:hypothetical protein [Geoalkalibacter ferrihydriticus]KIH77694.1 hypothetical protein GFER_03250 [Geoalkalibacter ferrihydriticus DSM 17813]SDL74086.1 hypothetical protein SAMN05660860_01164 [Geoalkalibacter ferrihydriticus]
MDNTQLSARPFEYPLGFQPWRDDLTGRPQPQGEGYTYELLENSRDAYRFHAVMSAARIAELFREFSRFLGGEAFFILEFYEEQVGVNRPADSDERPLPTIYYSPYLPLDELFSTIDPYLQRLIHDGFVGFGLANNREGMELFYSEEKVLTCFTGNHIRIMDLFARFGLRHDQELLFPTDFGHDHVSLLWHPRQSLPDELRPLAGPDLDYINFCRDLTEILDMYPVEESLSFFLSKRDQDIIEDILAGHPEYSEFAEDDFGNLLFDWNDFVLECEAGFTGDLWEYRQGLTLRDVIQYVLDAAPETQRDKILDIIIETDQRFQKILIDCRKRIDQPTENPRGAQESFWYHGVVHNPGAELRRDLIRTGWYQS